MIFLYFACLLPSIAFGSLNDENTRGVIGKFIHFVHLFQDSVYFNWAALVTGNLDIFYLMNRTPLRDFVPYIHDIFLRRPEKLNISLDSIVGLGLIQDATVFLNDAHFIAM